MDYNAKVKELEETRAEWLELNSGTHKVEFLGEGEEYTTEWEGETRDKVRFPVRYQKKDYLLSTTKGKTTASFYGQLMLAAAKLEPKNLMNGKVLTIAVKNATGKDGKAKRDFTVLDVLSFLNKEEAI